MILSRTNKLKAKHYDFVMYFKNVICVVKFVKTAVLSQKIVNTTFVSRKGVNTAFLSRKFIDTRSSIAFCDLLDSSIAPHIKPHCIILVYYTEIVYKIGSVVQQLKIMLKKRTGCRNGVASTEVQCQCKGRLQDL